MNALEKLREKLEGKNGNERNGISLSFQSWKTHVGDGNFREGQSQTKYVALICCEREFQVVGFDEYPARDGFVFFEGNSKTVSEHVSDSEAEFLLANGKFLEDAGEV